uniref:F-box protein 16 n=1 Tax=Cyclopterus lumpus TaxID=8103 RepID=A0A8C2WTA6_CYCLU
MTRMMMMKMRRRMNRDTLNAPWSPSLSMCRNSVQARSGLCQFDRWSGGQRKAVLEDLVLSCSVEQLRFLNVSVSRRLPLQAADLCCLLPRALCLYLFSFLDPRSLCRCARVSWHWWSIVELDQLWMPKCVRRGWCISFSPAPLEQGVWKRHYIQTVQELQVGRSDPEPTGQISSPVVQDEQIHPSASTTQPPGSISRTGLRKEKLPWRDSDRRPRDTLRFNYLDNLDPLDPLDSIQLILYVSLMFMTYSKTVSINAQ